MLFSDPEAPEETRERALARSIALRLLARREYTESELFSNLGRKGVSADVAGEVIGELQCEGLQSDDRFTAEFVRQRLQKCQGPNKIRYDIRQRGIGDDLLTLYLPQDDEVWLQHAIEALMKRSRSHAVENDADAALAQRARDARFLTGRGYPHGIVRRALEALQ